jgi:putative ABC transport system ATP-binding protein
MVRLKIRQLRYLDLGPFDLSIEDSECVCISGPSGAGKTFMLRAIADLEPHGGLMYLDAARAEEMSPSEWRRKVGMLPAESCWWKDTVGAHFRKGNDAWLETLGLDSEVMKWPVSRLSSGERQRLALLRLLCNRPKVLLLDEPTANLDSENAQKVELLLNTYRMQQNASLLWVSHDHEQIKRVAGRRLILKDGTLSEHSGH